MRTGCILKVGAQNKQICVESNIEILNITHCLTLIMLMYTEVQPFTKVAIVVLLGVALASSPGSMIFKVIQWEDDGNQTDNNDPEAAKLCPPLPLFCT